MVVGGFRSFHVLVTTKISMYVCISFVDILFSELD